MPMPSAGAYDWLDDDREPQDGEQTPILRGEPPAVPPGAPPMNPAAAGQGDTPQFVNPGTGDPEVGMFIRATDVQWAKLVELGVTSMRKLIDYLAATDASARCNGAPAGVPVVLKRSLFNWCRDSGRQVHLEIEAAVACGYLIQGGVAPYEWLHCCPPGGVQAPPATQIAATAAGRDRSMYKSRLCRNWLQWGSCRYAECCQFAHGESELRRPAPLHVDRRIPDAMLASVDGLTSAMGAAGLNGQPHAMLPPPHGLTTSFDDRAAAAQAAANGGGMAGGAQALAPPAGFQPRALPAGVPEGPRPQEAARPKTRLCIHFERGSCTYGSRCAFAHGVTELASDSQPHMPPRLHGGDWRCTACQHVNVAARELCSRCASHRRFVEAPPPPGYVCRLCGVAGHWIHSCPSEANRTAILPSQPKPLHAPPFGVAALPTPQGPTGLSASQLPAARPVALGATAPPGLDGGPMAALPRPQPPPLQNNPAALQNPATLPGAGSSANGAKLGASLPAQLQALGPGGPRLGGPNVGPSLGPGVPNLAAVERLCALTGVDKLICAQALRDCQGDVRAAAELLLTADPNNRGVAHTALPAAGPKAGPQPGVQDVGAALRAQDQAARLALQQEAVAQLPRAGGLSEEALWAVPSALLQRQDGGAALPASPPQQQQSMGGLQAAGGLQVDAKSCCLCLDAPKTHIVLPCGHKCLCASCAAGFHEGGGRFCPLCRSPMDRVQQVFE